MNGQNSNNGYSNYYNNPNYYNPQNYYSYNNQQAYQNGQYVNQNNMYYYPNQTPYYQNGQYPNYSYNPQYNQYPNYPNYSNQNYYNNYPNQNNNPNYNNVANTDGSNIPNPRVSTTQNNFTEIDDEEIREKIEDDIPANTDPIEEDDIQNDISNEDIIIEDIPLDKEDTKENIPSSENTSIGQVTTEVSESKEKIDAKEIDEITNTINEGRLEEIKQPEKPKFSILERYGEDLTEKEYITNPAIAREDEIRKLILVLLTPDKSACLVGKPGIGKTAIVEGLAYRIMNNNVPNVLKDYRIVDVATSSLLGESVSDGERDSRIQLLVQEVMNMDKIILFIDEIHTLMGAGAKEGSSLDFANILKPALARGNVKLIGATTSDEYERYMIRDRAFIRRFEKIDVAEPDIPTTVKILMGSYPRIEKKTGVKLGYSNYIKEKLLTFIVEMTSEYKRLYELSSRYPDIALALLSKSFSFAIFENSDVVKIKHIWLAINTCNSIYPDSRAKEVERFKIEFADLIKEEGLDVNAPIDVE